MASNYSRILGWDSWKRSQNSRYGLIPVEGRHVSLYTALLGFKRSDVEIDTAALPLTDTTFQRQKSLSNIKQMAPVVTELFSTSHKTKPVANTTERNQCGVIVCLDVICSFNKWFTSWFYQTVFFKHRFPPFFSPKATKVESVISIELGSSTDCDWSRTKA